MREPPAELVLPVSFVGQQTEVWCWAATSEMLLRFYGLPGTQCEIASFWLNAPCCPFGNAIQQCYQGARSMENIVQALAIGGLQAQLIKRPLTFEEVRLEIASGRPVMIGYRGSFAGHVVILHGYDSSGNIYIHDPYYGSFVVPYAISGLYNGAQIWSETIVNVRPGG